MPREVRERQAARGEALGDVPSLHGHGAHHAAEGVVKIIHKFDWVEGWIGSGRIAFYFTVPRGKNGKSAMVLLVDPETILKLADIMQRTGCTTPDTCGHAVYHLQHPELAVPCSSCAQKVSQKVSL